MVECVSGTAEMPMSGHPGQEPTAARPSGDKPGLGALPVLEASRQQAAGLSHHQPSLPLGPTESPLTQTGSNEPEAAVPGAASPEVR